MVGEGQNQDGLEEESRTHGDILQVDTDDTDDDDDDDDEILLMAGRVCGQLPQHDGEAPAVAPLGPGQLRRRFIHRQVG